MSLRELMEGHAATVFLNTDHFAEGVTHIAGGSTETVSAVVTIDPPAVSKDRGDGRVFTPSIQVLGTVDVTLASQWRVRGAVYGTEKIAPTDEAGMRMVELKKSDGVTRGAR